VGNALVYWFAKGLELLGLICLPLAMAIGIPGGDFRAETWLALVGVVAFFTGVMLERMSGRKPDKLNEVE
jgi:cytosine/uracil/thiamine/allantoin permease